MKTKLTPDQEHWANEVQTQPLPSWVEAFDYAYNLAVDRVHNCDVCSIIQSAHSSDLNKLIEAEKEIKRLQEYEWMYKELCK